MTSDSMPLNSHIQLTTRLLFYAYALNLHKCETAKYSCFKYCIITDCSLYHQTADKMHTEQMLGSTFAFPAALTWVTDSTTGAIKLAQGQAAWGM